MVMKRETDGYVCLMLKGVKNVSKRYKKVVLKPNGLKKIVFSEYPSEKTVRCTSDTMSCDVYLNDGETNFTIDKQRILNLM